MPLHRLAKTYAANFSLLLASSVNAQTVREYSYDSLGRLIGVGDGQGVISTYGLDAAGNRSRAVVTKQFSQAWSAIAPEIGHLVGRSEADGWSARVEDPEGYMIYGPYTYGVSAGNHVAAYRALLDNNVANNLPVIILDVWDATTGSQLAVRQLSRLEWKAANAYQVFELPFNVEPSRVGHALEFRIYYQRTSYVRIEKVGYR